jgi:hypothetical protein
MYANICRTTNPIEREIAERQLGMKAINDNSWFSKLKQILAIYELPSSHNILDLPPTKHAWKKTVNKAVNEYWIEHTGLSIVNLFQELRLFECLQLFQWKSTCSPG